MAARTVSKLAFFARIAVNCRVVDTEQSSRSDPGTPGVFVPVAHDLAQTHVVVAHRRSFGTDGRATLSNAYDSPTQLL